LLQDRERGWDHLGVLLSLVYSLVRCLFGLLAVLVRSDPSKDQIGRVRYEPADRLWFAALSGLVPRRQPATS
jgi:putative transposase